MELAAASMGDEESRARVESELELTLVGRARWEGSGQKRVCVV